MPVPEPLGRAACGTSSACPRALPLTAAQQEVWEAWRRVPDGPAYQSAEYREIQGPLEPRLFAQALQRTVGEASALRMRFFATAEGPRQCALVIEAPGKGFPLHRADLRDRPDPDAEARAWMAADLERPFPPGGPLFRYALFRVGEAHWLWYRRFHHLVVDDFGRGLLVRRTAEVHDALAAGLRPPDSPFGRLSDLLADEAAYRASDQYEADRDHWSATLAGRPAAPTLAGRAAHSVRTPLRDGVTVPGHLLSRLRSLTADLNATRGEVLTAVLGLYVARSTGSADVVLGVPMPGRTGPTALSVPGVLRNVLPLRLTVRPHDTFATLTRQVVLGLRAARRHQRYPLPDIRRDLGRSVAGPDPVGPLVEVRTSGDEVTFAGAPAVPHPLSGGPVRDLALTVRADSGSSGLRVEYAAHPERYAAGGLRTHVAGLFDLLAECGPHTPLGVPDRTSHGGRRALSGVRARR
ncbi:condensation domain-containing protein [Streptomyces sclerotialus]|uniref:condensation domain-containing protein n=1 Tax=Streptomyces sclerotialus TaxID=1957 RepID=UPI0004C530DF